MVLEKLSLDPIIVGLLSAVAIVGLWFLGVRGDDLATAGILIVGVMTFFGNRYPVIRIAVLVGSVVTFFAIMTGIIPRTIPPLTLLSGLVPCVILVYSRPLYSNENAELVAEADKII